MYLYATSADPEAATSRPCRHLTNPKLNDIEHIVSCDFHETENFKIKNKWNYNIVIQLSILGLHLHHSVDTVKKL